MIDDKYAMTDGLLRQRRNLFLICMVLFLWKYGGATLSKLNIAGIELELKNGDGLLTLLWIVFGYFLSRYTQYYITDGRPKFQLQLADAYERHCNPIIKDLVLRECVKQQQVPERMLSDNYQYRYCLLKKNRWIFTCAFKADDGTFAKNEDQSAKYSDFLEINRWKLKKGIFLALFEIFILKNGFTDYWWPFLLAFLILFYYAAL